jgi:hypothetical protein
VHSIYRFNKRNFSLGAFSGLLVPWRKEQVAAFFQLQEELRIDHLQMLLLTQDTPSYEKIPLYNAKQEKKGCTSAT